MGTAGLHSTVKMGARVSKNMGIMGVLRDPTLRQFDPRTLEFSCGLEQFNAITLQFIVSYTLKKASCLRYYHSSIDLHDNLYARPHPACEKRFSRSRFQSSLACSVEKLWRARRK